jgi:hypothetical protein
VAVPAKSVRRVGGELVDEAGARVLWLSDTWWWGMSSRIDDLEFSRLVSRRAAQGFTAAFVVVGPAPDVPLGHASQSNAGGRAWGTGGADPGYLEVAARRLRLMARGGLVPVVVGAWGYHLEHTGVPAMIEHWKRLIDRFGELPAVWCAAGEALMPPASALGAPDECDRVEWLRRGWTTVLQEIRARDAGRHPVTIHPSFALGHNASTDMVPAELIDMQLLQTGHEGISAAVHSLGALARAHRAYPRLPAIVTEVDYEGIMSANGPELQRLLIWTHLLAGASGHGYGAHGLWGFDEGHTDDPGARWGSAHWRRAAQLPGATQQGLARRVLLPFGALEAAGGRVEARPGGRLLAAAVSARGALVVYLPQAALQPDGKPILELRVRGGSPPWRVRWLDPRRGAVHEADGVEVDADGLLLRRDVLGVTPTAEDWVLVVEPA